MAHLNSVFMSFPFKKHHWKVSTVSKVVSVGIMTSRAGSRLMLRGPGLVKEELDAIRRKMGFQQLHSKTTTVLAKKEDNINYHSSINCRCSIVYSMAIHFKHSTHVFTF